MGAGEVALVLESGFLWLMAIPCGASRSEGSLCPVGIGHRTLGCLPAF